MMRDDMELVRHFADVHSEPAFAALVQRHIGLVYSAALRQVSDPHLAEEITQAVFIVLARKAASLGPKTILPAWLYRTTRYTAADALKARRRRLIREQEAHMQSPLNEPDTDAWAQLAPMLDDAMAELPEADRTALVLRFFENRTAREIGEVLRIKEAAAQKRVARALEKLRVIFAKRGVTVSAALLVGAAAANSAQAAPASLAATVITMAATGISIPETITILVKGTMNTMTWLKLKFAAGVGLALLVAGGAATLAISQTGGGEKPMAQKTASKTTASSVANPLYLAWKGQEGKTITFNRTESISGGAPVGGARPASSSPVQFTLSDFSPDQATIKVATGPNQPAETLILPARLMPEDPALPKSAGTEELKLGDKTYACTKYTYSANSKAELGRDPQGLRGSVTVWMAEGVPGGIVQRKISLTIRVSYNITDTLVP
jgi:RNA polymerase sigma factor (sigma-70 family)